jgi:hypothetical protein
MRRFEVAKLAVEKYLECLELYKINRGDRKFEEAAKRAARLAHMLRNEESSSKVKERLLKYARGFDASQEYEPCVDIAEALAGAPRLGLMEDEVKEVLEILGRAALYYREEQPAREAAFGDVEGPNEFMVRLAHQVRIELGGSLVDRPTKRLEINRPLERQADARRNNSPSPRFPSTRRRILDSATCTPLRTSSAYGSRCARWAWSRGASCRP